MVMTESVRNGTRMKTGAVAGLLLGIALATPGPACAEVSEFGLLLKRAEQARNKDMARFEQLIARMESLQGDASAAEKRHLRLLRNYQGALRGQYETVIGDSVALYDQAPETELKYRAALLVANVSAINREYLFGLRYLDRALALRDRIDDREMRHVGDRTAATLFNEFGHFELALAQAERLLADEPTDISRCVGRHIRVRALHGIGRKLDEDGEVHEAIADCAAQNEGIAVGAIRSTLAEYWATKGKTRQAVALLEASLPEAVANGYTRLVGEIQSQLARLKLELGDLQAAEQHAAAIVRMKGRDSLSLASVTAEKVLYEVALRRGDADSALRHYRLYAEADKARIDDIKAREYAFQLSRHEIAQKNQSIELLSNQNQLLRLQQEVAQKAAWNSRLAIALLVVLAGSLGYWGWRGRRMHRTLRQLAQTDSLTGLSNRRHFRAQSESVLGQSAQRGRPVSLLLFDLDHFKQINDQCGHAAGDWVLREVARVGRLHCREGDVFGRIGGEEFALTLVDCDLEDAEHVAEQCRRAIAGIDAREAGCTLPVSASIGCVGTSISGYDYEVLVAHADAAMYQSKVGGRNRVSLYQASPLQAMGLGARSGYEAAAMV
jgi:diguanylate cyclase (GGDEF)-like protein